MALRPLSIDALTNLGWSLSTKMPANQPSHPATSPPAGLPANPPNHLEAEPKDALREAYCCKRNMGCDAGALRGVSLRMCS